MRDEFAAKSFGKELFVEAVEEVGGGRCFGGETVDAGESRVYLGNYRTLHLKFESGDW